MTTNTPPPECQVKNGLYAMLEKEKRLSQAKEIIKKFPVTKEMFPQIKCQAKWIVCK